MVEYMEEDYTQFCADPYPSPLPVWARKNTLLDAIAKWGNEKSPIDSYRKALNLINKNTNTIGHSPQVCADFKELCTACFGDYVQSEDKSMADSSIENFVEKMKTQLNALVKGTLQDVVQENVKLNRKSSGVVIIDDPVKERHVEHL